MKSPLHLIPQPSMAADRNNYDDKEDESSPFLENQEPLYVEEVKLSAAKTNIRLRLHQFNFFRPRLHRRASHRCRFSQRHTDEPPTTCRSVWCGNRCATLPGIPALLTASVAMTISVAAISKFPVNSNICCRNVVIDNVEHMSGTLLDKTCIFASQPTPAGSQQTTMTTAFSSPR